MYFSFQLIFTSPSMGMDSLVSLIRQETVLFLAMKLHLCVIESLLSMII